MKPFILLLILPFVWLPLFADKVSSELKKEFYSKNFQNTALPIVKRIEYGDSLRLLTPNMNFGNYLELGDMLYQEGRYAESAEMFSQLLQTLPEDSLSQRLRSHWEIGLNQFTRRNYNSVLETAYTIMNMEKPDSLLIYNLYACTLLCDYYRVIHKWDLACKYQKTGAELAQKLKPNSIFTEDSKSMFIVTFAHCKASILMDQGKYDEAFEVLSNIKPQINYINGELIHNVISAEIASKKGEPELAASYFKEALKIENNNFNRCSAAIGYMKLLLEKGDTSSFRTFMRDYHADIRKISHSPLEREHLENLADYMHIKGDLKKEVEYRKRIIAIADSLYSASLEMNTDAITNKYEYAQFEDKLNISARESRRDHIAMAVLGAIILILCGASVWLWISRRHGLHKISSLESEREVLLVQHEKNSEQARKSLELRTQELSSMTMYMARLNEALSSIQKDTRENNLPEKKRLENISKVINELERQDNVWEMFRTYFDSVNHSFSSKLYELHPDLTNAEVRMCAFILMGLTTKEIAILTNRSARTVEVIKYNLRKKLGIEESTSAYLNSLACR